MFATLLSRFARTERVADPIEQRGYECGMEGQHTNPHEKKTPAYDAFEKGQKRAACEQAMYY